ncbi:unnamed protein product [Cunninghamella echinulata]
MQGFINTESLKTEKSLLENSSTTQVPDTGIIFHQLRQIRIQSHSPSTYRLCRAFGPLTNNHTCHRFTIYISRTRPSLKNGNHGKLAKHEVNNWINEQPATHISNSNKNEWIFTNVNTINNEQPAI